MANLIDVVDETLLCAGLKCSTADVVDHSLILKNASLEREGLSVGDPIDVERLQVLQVFLSVLRANHAITEFKERIPWPRRRFYLNMFIY